MNASVLFCAAIWIVPFVSLLAFAWHWWQFSTSTRRWNQLQLPSVSVLIPVRNEAATIEKTLRAVLANHDVDLEVVVLDDQSEDDTAARVRAIAADNERIRLVSGQPLPPGWNGKQYACHQLAQQARHDLFLFLDADVHLTHDAVPRCTAEREIRNVDLLSGFPRQIVKSFGEGLLLPFIHLILLNYLPFYFMRRTPSVTTSAGCGQLMLATRAGYQRMGGHASIRGSLHDGVQLPRAFRAAGGTTDIFDARDIASCRMYRGWLATWRGLSKNAYEGIANEQLIGPFTVLLLITYVLPPFALATWGIFESALPWQLIAGTLLAWIPRIAIAWRYDRHWASVAVFPIAVLIFLGLQWMALWNHRRGVASQWRGRSYALD